MAIFLGFKKPNDIRYSDKDNYLPKSGGTMSGDIDLEWFGVRLVVVEIQHYLYRFQIRLPKQ